MKKIIAIILSGVMLLSVCSCCPVFTDGEDTESQSESEVISSTPSHDEESSEKDSEESSEKDSEKSSEKESSSNTPTDRKHRGH